MDMTGEQLIHASQQATWAALNDPAILKACVPGCESIDRLSENEYQVLLAARVGPVSARFKGKLTIRDPQPPHSYSIAFEGQGGAAGFGKGSAIVSLTEEKLESGRAGTKLSYQVKASVGGKLAQIGSRLVDAAAKKMAEDFFKAFNDNVATHQPAPGPVGDQRRDERHQKLPAFIAIGAFVVGVLLLFALFA